MTKQEQIAEWQQVIRQATSYDGKLYAKYMVRKLRGKI